MIVSITKTMKNIYLLNLESNDGCDDDALSLLFKVQNCKGLLSESIFQFQSGFKKTAKLNDLSLALRNCFRMMSSNVNTILDSKTRQKCQDLKASLENA